MERTLWHNWNLEDGPRNGQVNGVFFNKESTETWEELQAAENELKQKQQPRRNRNNKRREQKKLSTEVKIQRLKTELSGWRKVVRMTSAKNDDERTVAAWKGTKAAMKWWLRRENRTEVEFQVYVNTMAIIKKECLQVWGVISSWAEAYFKTAETGLHFLDKPSGGEIMDGTFKYAKMSGSALYRIAQAGASLIDTDLTMAMADSIQMQEEDEERINKMRRKAAHRKRWKLQYSGELERQKAGQRRQASDRRSDEELVTNLETVWDLVSYKCTLESRVNSWRKSREDIGRRYMARQALKQKADEEQVKAYEEQMELSEYTKLALLNAITKQNNDQQSHRLENIARGEGAMATAVREALNLVDMDLTDGQKEDYLVGMDFTDGQEGEVQQDPEEEADQLVLCKLRETIRKLQESRVKADEAQEFLDVMTVRHAKEGCVECQKRSHCQASGCKGSVCTCREECKDGANCPLNSLCILSRRRYRQ